MNSEPKIVRNKGGRPKGVNGPLRSMIGQFLQKNWRDVERAFKKLEPKDKVLVYERLMKYYMPQLQSISQAENLEAQIKNLDSSQLEELVNKILDAHNLQNGNHG